MHKLGQEKRPISLDFNIDALKQQQDIITEKEQLKQLEIMLADFVPTKSQIVKLLAVLTKNKPMKILLFIMFSLSALVSSAQNTDTLDCFYLNRSNYSYESNLKSYFDDDMKQRSQKYHDWLKNKVVKYYSSWNGENEFIVDVVSSSHFTLKEEASYLGTDYFEVYFAKHYMDSTYLIQTIREGEMLCKQYILKNKNNKSNDYLKVLERVKQIIPEDDFFLMFAFADKLKKEICFMRINGESNKFFLLIGDNSKFVISDYMIKNYKKLESTDIPVNYVIQPVFKEE